MSDKKPAHDIKVEDLTYLDLDRIKSFAMEKFRRDREVSQVPLIIDGFMTFLVSEGYRIEKIEDKKEE